MDAVDICNLALQAVGTRSTITSLNEDSNEAKACLQVYDNTVLRTIRGAPWGCTKKFANLTLWKAAPGTPQNPNANPSVWTPEYPPPPWLYSYLMPADSVWMRFIIPQLVYNGFSTPIFTALPAGNMWGYTGPYVKYSIATDEDEQSNRIKVILTNQESAIACYNTNVTDVDVWDNDFQDAVVFAIAAQISMPLTGDQGLVKLNYQLANQKWREAREADNNESVVQQDIIPDWLRVRTDYYNQAWSGGIPGTLWAPYWPVPV